jgi:hypothetical protein
MAVYSRAGYDMNGIHAAFTGRLGAHAEIKRSKAGKPWVAFPVVINREDTEAPATWIRVAIFGDKAEDLAHRLTKGAEVYCEGKLSWGSWTGKVAGEVQPMGQLGRKKPTPPSRRSMAIPGYNYEHGGKVFAAPSPPNHNLT